jgi:putative intracellular protease/amidase
MAAVLIPLPRRDFDPTEVAVSWKLLKARGHSLTFATPEGDAAEADPIMVDGVGLDPWGWIPGLRHLKLIGLVLRANAEGRAAYRELAADSAFQNPLRWRDLAGRPFDGLLLAGGHRARGMREYLESEMLQSLVAQFFHANRPVAAICHGVLLAARSLDANGRSVLFGRKTTALTWKQERSASVLAHLGRFWDRHYYRTYVEAAGQPPGYMSVQSEVTRALSNASDFLDVLPGGDLYFRKTSGAYRDSPADPRPAFVVSDGNYISARWPGDVHTFATRFAQVLEGHSAVSNEPSPDPRHR